MHRAVFFLALICAASFGQVAQGVTLKWCAVEGKEKDGVTEKQKCDQMISILNAETDDVRAQIRALFMRVQDTQIFQNLFFKTVTGAVTNVVNPGDLVFKCSTMKLEEVDSDMISFMGPSYDVYEELEEAENVPCSAEVPVNSEDVETIIKRVDSGDDGIPTWGIAVIVVISIISFGMLLLLVVMWKREREGNPLFSALIDNPLSAGHAPKAKEMSSNF